mgnify:CR=1 FL=1
MRQAIWRTVLKAVKDGKRNRIKAADWPASCDACSEQMRAMYGCGYVDGLRGSCERETPTGLPLPTCPQWVAIQPAVVDVWSYVADFRSGRMGNVFDMPACLYDLLRVASAELDEWQSVQQERLSDGD